MWLPEHATLGKDLWRFLGRDVVSLNTVFFKGLRKKVREACTFLKSTHETHAKTSFMPTVPYKNFRIFTKRKEYNPHTRVG